MSWYFLKTYGYPREDKSRGWCAFQTGAIALIMIIVVFGIYVLLGAK